jgi:ubiquitin-protein ligase
MMTHQELRRTRLQNDHVEMLNIRGAMVDWRAIAGAAPYIEGYDLTVRVRTIIDSRRAYRSTHSIQLILPEGYPTARPELVMTSRPQPYHPNWYGSGKWCSGDWYMSEGLGHHVVRMLRTLQFDPEITNPLSPANSAAKDWYLANQGRGWFPTDKQVLPDPTHSLTFVIDTPPAKVFRME